MIVVFSAATGDRELVAEGRVQCTRAGDRHAGPACALGAPPATPSSSPTDAAATVAQLQAIYQRLARRMAALTPPKAIQADYKVLVASYQLAAKYAGAWRDAILRGNVQQAADASHKLYLNSESVRASNGMARIGLKGYDFGTFFH